MDQLIVSLDLVTPNWVPFSFDQAGTNPVGNVCTTTKHIPVVDKLVVESIGEQPSCVYAVPVEAALQNTKQDSHESPEHLTTLFVSHPESPMQETHFFSQASIQSGNTPQLDAIKELWKFLKEFRWEGLVMLLKTCHHSMIEDLISWINLIASYMNELHSVIQITFEVRNKTHDSGLSYSLIESIIFFGRSTPSGFQGNLPSLSTDFYH